MPDFVDPVQEAWTRHTADLIRMQGVISVHCGRRERAGKMTDEECLVITVIRKLPLSELAPSQILPPTVQVSGGQAVGTDVVEDPAGYPTIEQDDASYRPVPGGCSIGTMAVRGFVGTLGGWFCAPRADGAGWDPVWLSNAHVVDITNQNAVPADPRIDQPFNSGAVIGNTIAVSGWPAAVAAPGVTLNGFMDAAIGDLAEEVEADYEVLQIGPAPFELGNSASGLAVQKRGRTSRLTQGTINTASITVNVTDGRAGGGGVVAFGLPGQPAVSRIVSNTTGLANAFGRPGDSGSLVFDAESGQLDSTVPCLGLYFAGNFRSVQNSPNPNALTVRGFMFNIQAVVQQFNLELVCSCVARQIIDAILRGQRADRDNARGERGDVGAAAKSLRAFRDGVLAKSSRGRVIADAVAQSAPEMARVLTQDPEAFELAVELLTPFVDERIGMRVLTKKIEPETVELAQKLAQRVIEISPKLAAYADPTVELLQKQQGRTVGRLIGSVKKADLTKNAKAAEKSARAAKKRAAARRKKKR